MAEVIAPDFGARANPNPAPPGRTAPRLPPPARASRPAFRFETPDPAARTEIGIDGIARLLGMADRPVRAIVERIRLLIEKYGFPPPKTQRFVKGVRQQGAAAVGRRSRWHRDQVEMWFENDTPPAAAAQTAGKLRDELRAQLAGRAQQLVA